ncbi:Uncharacterised protein [uncultured archaeon]|nr:Uncharacterised protein [uncultured archaeon]
MKKISEILIVAVLIALVAPAIAELSSEEVDTNYGIEQLYNASMMKPMDPHYIWINPLAIELSGVNPEIFQNTEFSKDPDGMSSGNQFTASISRFLNADPNAGVSKVVKRVAKVGLVHWPESAHNSS